MSVWIDMMGRQFIKHLGVSLKEIMNHCWQRHHHLGGWEERGLKKNKLMETKLEAGKPFRKLLK